MIHNWSDWRNLGEINDSRILFHWPGVYQIRLVRAEGIPIPLGRFLRIDENGTLMVGVSDDVGKRVKKFSDSYIEDKRTHSEGRRLHLVGMLCGFGENIYGDSWLEYRGKRIPEIEDARFEEERLLKRYFKRFGELPPINATLGKGRVGWMNDTTLPGDPW